MIDCGKKGYSSIALRPKLQEVGTGHESVRFRGVFLRGWYAPVPPDLSLEATAETRLCWGWG